MNIEAMRAINTAHQLDLARLRGGNTPRHRPLRAGVGIVCIRVGLRLVGELSRNIGEAREVQVHPRTS